MVRGERVLELDRLLHLATGADRNRSCHWVLLKLCENAGNAEGEIYHRGRETRSLNNETWIVPIVRDDRVASRELPDLLADN